MIRVTADDKEQFIQWFIERFDIQQRAVVWFLNVLRADRKKLADIHFTTDVFYCPRAIKWTVHENRIHFQFKKGTVWTDDMERAFHDLYLVDDEPLYMEFDFPNRSQSPQYAIVMTEHPYMPENEEQQEQDQRIITQWVECEKNRITYEMAKKKIDEALDQKDEQAFFYWTRKLAQIQQYKK